MVERMLTLDEVRKVGILARLQLTDSEVHRLTEDLNVLLEHFEELEELDTSDVPPTFHVLELVNVTRADEVCPSLCVEEVVCNSPSVDGPFFVVPRIVETD